MKLKTFMVVVISLLLLAGNLWALDLGSDITIYDNRSGTYHNSSGNGWWTNVREDQEVEPHMIHNQYWDLEGFFLNGTTLYVVGGFDFEGYTYKNKTYHTGDIFIDTTDDASYGVGAQAGTDGSYGYEYVLDLNFNNKTYSVYELTGNFTLSAVEESENVPESNPWRLESGGSLVSGWENVSFNYWSSNSKDLDGDGQADVNFDGDFHNAFGVDLGFLNGISQFTTHLTIECGNDNLMGHYDGGGFSNVTPEPSTVLLLGIGLLGLGGISRKKFHKK